MRLGSYMLLESVFSNDIMYLPLLSSLSAVLSCTLVVRFAAFSSPHLLLLVLVSSAPPAHTLALTHVLPM